METPQLDPNKLIADLRADAENAARNLRSHHITISWMFLGILVLSLGLVGGIYLHSVQTFERLMAHADTENAQYHKDLSDLETQLKTDQQTIGQLEAQKAQVQTQIVYRDKSTDGKIEAVAAPNRSESQVSDDVQSAYKFPPVKVDSGLFLFTLPETQTFVVTKLDRDRLALDLQDAQSQVSLGTLETTTLANDVQAAKKQLDSANKVIADYKKIAKKSKFKTFLGNVEKVAIFVGGVYIGRKI